eukprot:TRINITY_DN91445_c0_g1_i1.p1 TRINITY_DN91445_c0_g1~~TRINITY_DN91445_c0_g1_i1.p1  ORF type:complete len:742 (-),score=124.09 TRINITY_DN91445_c0_g1_i1:92-2317(-)
MPDMPQIRSVADAAAIATSCCSVESRKLTQTDEDRGIGRSGNLRSKLRAMRHAFGAWFSAGARVGDTDRLRISSPCAGALTRAGEPRPNSEAASQQWGWEDTEGASKVWDGFCAVCKRPLTIALVGSQESMGPAKRSRHSDTAAGRYAFVITLWGSSPEYVLGALILVWSLRKTKTSHDMVLVHTKDVSSDALSLLQKGGWKLHEVEHISAVPALSFTGVESMRFAKVFTKLRVLQLVQYEKILLMDIDLLVRDNIDNLFDFPAPMAMVRGPEVGYEHGELVEGKRFFAGSREDRWGWGQSSGINAGVMLLHPNEDIFQQMLREVADERHPEHIQGAGPEQDYLSRFYAADWKHLSVAYNFQLHHVYFALSPVNGTTADRLPFIFQPDSIKVIHYSSEPKPWSRVLEDRFASFTDEEWLNEVLTSFSGYRAWVLKETECVKHEAERNGYAVGPNGNLHKIAWDRLKSRSSGLPDVESKSHCNGDSSGTDACLWSEDGLPLGEALEVSQDAVKAAQITIELSQDLWFKAYQELEADFGVSSLATAVKQATTGPVIRQDWDWSAGKADQANNSADNYSSSWTRKDTCGWWMQKPGRKRHVALCSVLPEKQVNLIVDSTVLYTATTEGVHVAAVSSTGPCPGPRNFASGAASDVDAASEWVKSLPDDAIVLLAVVQLEGGRSKDILGALKAAGLDCPHDVPAGCRACAAVGRKGSSWFDTLASSDVAVATLSLPETTSSTAHAA